MIGQEHEQGRCALPVPGWGPMGEVPSPGQGGRLGALVGKAGGVGTWGEGLGGGLGLGELPFGEDWNVMEGRIGMGLFGVLALTMATCFGERRGKGERQMMAGPLGGELMLIWEWFEGVPTQFLCSQTFDHQVRMKLKGGKKWTALPRGA